VRAAPSRQGIRHRRLIPPGVLYLGELVGVIYRSDKGSGFARTYIHLMQQPPYLVSDVEGRQLYIVGGSYRVTPLGIEDLPKQRGHE
jgi:hypothetical protein